MNLSQIKIHHFKGLEEVTLSSCGAVNALVGKNNSGKSSILHAIDMAGLALSVERWNMFQPKLEVKDLFGDVGRFSMSITYNDGSTVELRATHEYGPEFKAPPLQSQKFKPVLIFPDVASGMLRRRHRTPKSVVDSISERNFGDINALDILHAIKFYASTSQQGFTPETYTSLIEEIRRYFPDIDDVQSDRTEHDIATLTYSEYGRQLDILYSGTGLKHFLDVLLKTVVSGANVILLDEPELGLHPDLQRRFIEYLTRLAKDKKLQIFMATHSQVLLNYADSLTYYRVTNTRGKRQVCGVERGAVETLLSDLGVRPSDVLNQDICVLVEGASDVIYFEHIIRVLYKKEFERIAVGVLQYAGAAAEGIISGAIDVSNIVPVQRFLLWLRDRDAPAGATPTANATKFKNALAKREMECHIWARREIEFYFPEVVVVAAQQGDKNKAHLAKEILSGNQDVKFEVAAAKHGICVPRGKNLRNLLKEYLISREQLDQEIRGIVEGTLSTWKNAVLGKGQE